MWINPVYQGIVKLYSSQFICVCTCIAMDMLNNSINVDLINEELHYGILITDFTLS